jgi:hypothetical protein
MIDAARRESLTRAVQRYLDLMYDNDVSKFDLIFRPTAQLHGLRNGELAMWPAALYKDVLSKRESPKSLGAPREEEILLVDFASPTQALVKVRVRINSAVFVDYLTWHFADGDWRITSKGFHNENGGDPTRPPG